MRNLLGSLAVFVISAAATYSAEEPPRPTKIVLIAGPITGHGKDTHEYEKNVILLKHLLDTSPNVGGIVTETHFKGWPQDESTLDDADTIVMISDGGDHKETNHPLYVGNRMEVLEQQMKRGCGFVQFHWSTFNPSRFHDKITEWVGGYFDYEKGEGPRNWYSAIKTWEGPTQLGVADHPIARGVKPFRVQEEFYYNIRFRDDDPRLQPILKTRPPGETEDYTVGWAVEREDGGRGFGFTGGHFYRNWWNDDFRKLILNAIVWSSGGDVPSGGVASTLGEPMRALIITGHNHPAHDWRKVTAALIPALELDPRMVVEVTEHVEDLATARIYDYDLLVFNYSNWDRPGLSNEGKENFVNYLGKGGGLAVIHFANGCFTDTIPNEESDWPEFRTKIVRRIWLHGEGNSGHDAFGDFTVDITDAGQQHPITAGLDSFPTTDELYFRQHGEMPITPLASARSNVTGEEEPMAFAYNYGKGRVFQTVLGHADVSVRRAAAIIRRGSVWAAGRDQISFDPPVELTENVLFRSGSPWTYEESLKNETASLPIVDPLGEGRFDKALDARAGAVAVDGREDFRKPPLTVECWAKLDSKDSYNILVANESKSSATHWEIFATAKSGHYTAYLPGMKPDHVRAPVDITDGEWHYLAMIYEPDQVRLYIDGEEVASGAVERQRDDTVAGPLVIGGLVVESLGCHGMIDEVRISRGVRSVTAVPAEPFSADDQTIGLWRFDELAATGRFADTSAAKASGQLRAKKN